MHNKQPNAVDDVHLTHGEFYFVNQQEYKAHLEVAEDSKQVFPRNLRCPPTTNRLAHCQEPTCNQHSAVNDRFKTFKGKDITGIGAVACARHGCFCPGGVVDFEKGERCDIYPMTTVNDSPNESRQAYVDFALSEAIKAGNMVEIKRLLLLYDINCQYSVHLLERFARNKNLTMPEDLEIVHGIGLMHIGGHVPACFPRYSPSFIDGAGRVVGEILESLWNILNEISPSTQNASLAARLEMLNAHMFDSNYKKLTGICE